MIPNISMLPQMWLVLVLADVVLLGFGRAIEDDGRFLCFPSPKTEQLCICFDMEESAYTYVATNDLPPQMIVAVQGGYIDDTSSDEHTMDREMEHVHHEKITGSDVQELKSLLLNLIRQVSAYQGLSKRSHMMSKRPFDSISYGSYFGGFGKR
ncbi:uncharacterized protein [Argopecten irradians]|uniref:uncharacterized protein n=1 Tax=Argopecten irradians TaxID=31199 RepID=UPI00370FBC46